MDELQNPQPITPSPTPPEVAPDVDAATVAARNSEAAAIFQHGGEVEDPLEASIEKELGQSLESNEFTMSAEMVEAASQLAMGPDEVFRCINLTKSFGRGASYNEVIKGISFKVKRGEYIVIYGPSGSGKSTLLNMLAGLEIPTRGEIQIRGQVIQEFSDDDLAIYHREKIGLVFQNFNLLPSLRVWENVAFPLMLAGAPIEWRRHEALRMLERFDMADYATHFPTQLSGGQQQRVAMARALIHDPEILLVDEPTGNLDSVSADRVLKELERLHIQEERTIILVTHSDIFLSYATRVFYIKDGNLLTSHEQSSLNSSDGSAEPSPQLS